MRGILIAIILALVGLMPCAYGAGTPPLNCIILPDEQVDLGSPVPGVIEHIGVRRSDRVRKGQAIARLESSVEQATVALARARASTQTELELRKVEYSYDAQHSERLHTLKTRQAVSSQNMEDAERVAEAARLRVRLAEDKRREALLDQHRVGAVLARKTITSPIDGVVIQINNRVGEYVETRPVARIARLDPLRVEVIAPLAMFGSVAVGMQVAVGPETDPDNERRAIVSAVDAVADPGSGTFGIRLELPNPDLKLPAGIKCTARFLPQKLATVLPDQATVSDTDLPTKVTVTKKELSTRATATEKIIFHAPEASPVAACLSIEAHDSEQQAQRIAEQVRSMGSRVAVEKIETPRVFSYLVATPPEPQRAKLDSLVQQLRASGVNDLAVIRKGDNAGRISLGTYNGPRSADRRKKMLAQLGVVAQVIPRTRLQQSWRLDVRWLDDVEPQAFIDKLKSAGNNSIDLTDGCEPTRVAAR